MASAPFTTGERGDMTASATVDGLIESAARAALGTKGAPTGCGVLVLASSSPRRRQLLAAAGFALEVAACPLPEPDPDRFSSPEEYAVHTAWRKARHIAEQRANQPPRWILAADTVVTVGDQVLGKPIDRADAERILRALHGADHAVITGVALWIPNLDIMLTLAGVSRLAMRTMTESELRDYLDGGAWEGKAGAYGLQHNDPFITRCQGSFTNVVGLPMERLAALFDHAAALDPVGAALSLGRPAVADLA